MSNKRMGTKIKRGLALMLVFVMLMGTSLSAFAELATELVGAPVEESGGLGVLDLGDVEENISEPEEPAANVEGAADEGVTVTLHSLNADGTYSVTGTISLADSWNGYWIPVNDVDQYLIRPSTMPDDEFRFIGWSRDVPGGTFDGIYDNNEIAGMSASGSLTRIHFQHGGTGADSLEYYNYYLPVDAFTEGNVNLYAAYQPVAYKAISYIEHLNDDYNGGSGDWYSAFSVGTNGYAMMIGGERVEPYSGISGLYMEPAGTPEAVTREPLDSTAELEAGELYGEKTAEWVDYDERIGNIQFDFAIAQKTYDTDIVIVLNKSAYMNGYSWSGNSESRWEPAVSAVGDLASDLLGDGNSANNRVALVQFGGNTLNSFNFQSDYNTFDSSFVKTAPSYPTAYRNGEGEVLHTYDAGANPAGYFDSDYGLALEQVQMYANSRTGDDAERDLVVLIVTGTAPEATIGYRDMYYRSSGSGYDPTSHGDQVNAPVYTHWITFDMHGDGTAETDFYHRVKIGTQTHLTDSTPGYAGGNQYTQEIANVSGYSQAQALENAGASVHTIGVGNFNTVDWGTLASLNSTDGIYQNVSTGELYNTASNIFFDAAAPTTPPQYTDAIISDVITEDFEILVDATHPVTLEHRGVSTVLTESVDATPEVNEYYIEDISYNGGTRQQITVNLGTIDESLMSLDFYIQAVNPNLTSGLHDTNEEHLLSYKDGTTTVERNDLGDPNLRVETNTIVPTNPPSPEQSTSPQPSDPVEIPDPSTPLDPGVSPTPTQTPVQSATPTPSIPVGPVTTPTPVAPVTTQTPTPPTATPTPTAEAEVEIEEPEQPLVDAPDEEVEIEETETPTTSGSAWSLVDLILTITTGMMSVVLLIGYFRDRKSDEYEDAEVKRKGMFRLFSAVPMLGSILMFVMTQDLSAPMTFIDRWTILFAAITLVQVLTVMLSRKRYESESEAR